MTRGGSPLSPGKRLTLHACGASAVFAAIALTHLLAIRPISERTAELLWENQRLEAIIASSGNLRSSISTLENQIAATETELRKLLARLPDRPHVDQLMAALSQVADRSNTEVLSLQPQTTRSGELAAVQTVKLGLKCEHASLCRFLAALDSSPLVIWVAAIDLRSEDGERSEEGGGIRRADLMLQVPHAAQQTLTGKAKLALMHPPEA